MTDLREAVTMALEALEIAADGGGVNFYEYAKELRKFLEQQKDEPVALRETRSRPRRARSARGRRRGTCRARRRCVP